MLTRIVEYCAKNNILISIRVSLDGIGDVHNQVRAVKRGFDKALQTIEAMQQLAEIQDVCQKHGVWFDLHELEVSDVMVHRLHMRSVNADDPPEAVVREILQSPHTRMPLWRGTIDNIVGVVYSKADESVADLPSAFVTTTLNHRWRICRRAAWLRIVGGAKSPSWVMTCAPTAWPDSFRPAIASWTRR